MKAKLRTMLLSCLALLLVLGMTSVACAYDVSFSDVPEDSWFYTDVMTLAESGVIGGYPDGTYRPTKKVTTGEALKMILLAAGYPEPEPAASHWARGSHTSIGHVNLIWKLGTRLSEFCHRAGLFDPL